MNIEQKTRLIKILKKYAVILCIGLIYLLWVLATDLRIPCVFYLITDKYCPGCGISRMFVAMAKLDFKKAIGYNMFAFILLPVFLPLFIYKSAEYIKNGSTKDCLIEKIIYIVSFVLCIAFWILRNTEAFHFLAP